mmetsp:Transcript_3215/g.9026  ORF Transcript_3215/g.9026 Transcript_3215/m.9026 type:complete len:497 (-) Transcript_3215:203-1693(-)
MVVYGTVPEIGKYKNSVKSTVDRKYFYGSAILALGFLGAVALVSQGTRKAVLVQKPDDSWVDIVNSFMPDTKSARPALIPTHKLALEADKSLATPAVEQGKLDKLGVGVDSWPWEKPQSKAVTAASARAALKSDDLMKEMMTNFKDTVHSNPMLKTKKHRLSSLDAELIGKSHEQLPVRTGRLPIDTCSEDTPNCNKLRLETGIKVYGWPWDKLPENNTESAEEEKEEEAVESAKPMMLRGKPSFARKAAPKRGSRVAHGMALLQKRLASDSVSISRLAREGISPEEEESIAQALQKDAFLMAAASSAQQRQSQQLAGMFGLDPKGVACSRAIGGCNVSAQNVSDENVSHGWQMIPGWYWLPKTEGGQGIESKGINVDSWGGIFGAVRWQRHASQQLKEDAADMAWLADSDAATPNLKKRVSLRSADRKAWETRLASQLGKFSKGLAGIEQLDSVDGCKCAGSSDEDVGPRCSCSGQPDISSAKDEWSPSEVTSWS